MVVLLARFSQSLMLRSSGRLSMSLSSVRVGLRCLRVLDNFLRF